MVKNVLPEKEGFLKEIEEKFEEENIEYWEDDLLESWYKDRWEEEIMLINKNSKVFPLSDKSKIVGELDPFEEIRLYVKPEDRDDAKRIVEEAEK